MRNLSKKAKTIIAGAAIAGLASAGGAYAYWTTTGGGSGTATAASNYSTPLVITSSGPVTADIVPGSSNVVAVTVVNPNSGSAYANTVSGVVTLTNAPVADCTAADFAVDDITNFGLIPIGSTGVTKNTNLHFASTSLNQNGCKGVALTITWSNN